MMPLTIMPQGEVHTIKRVGGQDETRLFLEKLGFVPGAKVSLVTQQSGNVIVNIKESRVAISREMAMKIKV